MMTSQSQKFKSANSFLFLINSFTSFTCIKLHAVCCNQTLAISGCSEVACLCLVAACTHIQTGRRIENIMPPQSATLKMGGGGTIRLTERQQHFSQPKITPVLLFIQFWSNICLSALLFPVLHSLWSATAIAFVFIHDYERWPNTLIFKHDQNRDQVN